MQPEMNATARKLFNEDSLFTAVKLLQLNSKNVNPC